MNYYFFYLIFQKTFIFWFVNFIVGLPFTYFLTKRSKNIPFGITQLVGISILLILLSLIHYLKFEVQPQILFIFIIFTVIVFFTLQTWFKIKNKHKLSIIINKIVFLVKKDLFQFLIYFLFVLILVSPQKKFPPLIPSYEVNHDPIVILNLSKSLGEFDELEFNYPLGFSLILNYYHSFMNLDFYFAAHLINILLYSLSVIPLILFYKEYIFRKSIWIVALGVFFALLSYFPVQYLNQSFYGTISLTPFLFISIYFILRICESNKWSNYFLFVLFLSVGVLMYSLTIFLWLIPLLSIILFFGLFSKKFHFQIKKVFFSILVYIILSLPFLHKSLQFFYNFIFINNAGSESSFFGALGNTPDYPSLLIVFSSWFSNDFRFNDTTETHKQSWLFFIILIVFVLCSLIILKKHFKPNFIKISLLVFVVFILPILLSYFGLQSPYYFTKTLFYSSVLVMSFLYILIFLSFIENKNIFIFSFGVLVFGVFLKNSYSSINYLGLPPRDKFLKIQEMAVELKNEGVKNLLVIDDEDWLNYFLDDISPCIIFARPSFSCGLDRIKKIDNEYIQLGNEKYYLIGKKYQEKIIPTSSYRVVINNEYYSLLKSFN